MIEQPGIYNDVPESEYHGDPIGPSPSLSSSIAKLIVTRSPRHAWFEHPRLNKAKALEVETPTPVMDIGTAIHKLVLGEGKAIKEIPFDDFRGGEARKMRDAARAAGMVPVISDKLANVRLVAEAFRDQLAGTEFAGILYNGTPEATGVWQDEGGVWCRQRIDWLPAAAREGGHITVLDVKTTGTSAQPDDWQRHAYDMGYDIQDAFYQRGLRRLIPDVRSVRFVFAVIEQDAPYGLSLNEFGGQAFEEASILTDVAVKMWGACLARGSWPSYPVETAHIDPPKWRSERAEVRRLALLSRMANWQRPTAEKAA